MAAARPHSGGGGGGARRLLTKALPTARARDAGAANSSLGRLRRGGAQAGGESRPAAGGSCRGSCAPAWPASLGGPAATPPTARRGHTHRTIAGARNPSTAPRPGARGVKGACARSTSRQPSVPPQPSSPAGRARREEVGRRAKSWRSRGRRESRGVRFVMRSRRARGKSERAARLVQLLEAAAAPPDGSSASHRLWVTDTLSEGGEGTSWRAGPEGGDGVGPQREAALQRRVVSWEL